MCCEKERGSTQKACMTTRSKATVMVVVVVLVAVSMLVTFSPKVYAEEISRKDRAMGAIMGLLIGDALGVGTHWYYDLENLKKDFGPWISDYHDPKVDGSNRWVDVNKHRYAEGVRAGDVSQTGQFIIMLLESVAEQGSYNASDFTARVDKFFETINGTSYSGRYTDWAIRDTWKHRDAGIDWNDPEVGSLACTSEGAQRAVILAARYEDPVQMAKEACQNIKLTYSDPFIAGQSVAYALVVGGFINGIPVEEINKYMQGLGRDKEIRACVPSFDSMHQVGIGSAANNPAISVEPASLISQVYGQDCQMAHLVPAAYYLIHRYPDDFEMAVLSAINGGGNNMARAALTGAMAGAMVGLQGIPERLIQGLKDHERLLELADIVSRKYPMD